MVWENYIEHILESQVSDWIEDSYNADEIHNDHHNPDADDPPDAYISRSIVFLRRNISIAIRLPSRHPEFINGFRDREPYEDLPNGKSYFDTLQFLWCGNSILTQLVIGYFNNDTRCVLPASMEVVFDQYRLYRLINMVRDWASRDLSACEDDYEKNFKLCGRRIVSRPWPSTLWL